MDPVKDQLLDSFLESSNTLAAICSNDVSPVVTNMNNGENNLLKYYVEYIFNETMLSQASLQNLYLCLVKCTLNSCKAVFKLEENFKYHLKCHNLEEGSFTCAECFEKLSSWPQLQYHLWQIHELDLEMVTCEMCGYKADCAKLLDSHKIIHVGKRFFKCEICNEVFSWFSHLGKHLAVHEREMTMFSTALSENVENSSLSTVTNFVFKCELCQKEIEEESKFLEHCLEHSNCECSICYSCFPDIKSLNEHKVMIHNYVEHKCDLCDFKSLIITNLELHMKTQHPSDKHTEDDLSQDSKISSLSVAEYHCPYCDYTVSGLFPYKIHLKVQHMGKPLVFACKFCNFVTSKWISFQEHFNSHNTDQPQVLSCDFCGYTSKQSSTLKLHMNRHIGEKTYYCDHAKHFAVDKHEQLDFNSDISTLNIKSALTTIVEFGFKCDVCQKKFEEESKFLEHCLEHSDCECSICCSCFPDVKSLYEHKVVMHNCIEHKCDLCDFKSLNYMNLEHHIKVQHPDDKFKQGNLSPDSKMSCLSEAEYKCPYCSYTASRLLPYKIHLKLKHIGKPVVFACKFCTFVTSKWIIFQGHLNSHNTVQPQEMSCNLCGYTTRHSSALTVHMRRHTGEKPYHCDLCDYKTAEKYRLKYHKMKHSGEKLFHCVICNYSAMRADLYKIHLKSKHDGQGLFTCTMCTCSFVDESKFQHHMEAHKDGIMSLSDIKDIDKKICSLCDYSTYRISDFRRHLRQHTGEKPFQCSLCDYKTDKRYRYESHIRKHAEEHLYRCPHCDYITKQNFKYKLHLITKHPKIEQLFSCELCSFISVGENELQEHINAHKIGSIGKISEKETNEDDNRSSIANKCNIPDSLNCNNLKIENLDGTKLEVISDNSSPTVTSELSLVPTTVTTDLSLVSIKSNEWNNKVKLETHCCSICGYSTNYISHFTKHLLLHSADNPFICEECGFRTDHREKLKQHMLFHLGIKKHQCPYCPYAVNNTFIFKKHLKVVHPGEKGLFSCQMCCYSFVDEKKFKEHVSSHQISLQNALLADKAQLCKDPTKKHICNECGYSTNILFSFKRHSRQHTGEKPFECDQCDYRAAHKHLLKIHKMTHTGEKRFKCTHCPYAVSNDYAFKKHMATRHPNKGPFSCESCSFSSADHKKFFEHVKSHEISPASNTTQNSIELTNYIPAMDFTWPNNLISSNTSGNNMMTHIFPSGNSNFPTGSLGNVYGSCLYESSIVKHFFTGTDLNISAISSVNFQNNNIKNEPSQSTTWPGNDCKQYI